MRYIINKIRLVFIGITLCFLVIFIKINKTDAASPEINLSVNSVASASNGYGGVNIDVDLKNINGGNYVYEIKRSSDYIYWQNIGLGFNYNKKTNKIYPYKIKVLNVYPDNDSFILSEELKKVYSETLLENMKKIYSIEDGTYVYNDNSSSVMPRSASLKVWIEGGKYKDGTKTYYFEDLSHYNGYKMLEIYQMSMKEFNSTVTSCADLSDYDTIFFGTWDANGWNDLNDVTYEVVKNYIKEGRGVVFGHDTIAYEISDMGVFTGRFEHENMCKLYNIAGFDTIPKKYAGSSMLKKNSDGLLLPVTYQLWGGSGKKQEVTVRFSKTKRAEDASLTTFPYDLLGENGTPRDLIVPQTHTSWMGLKYENNNIVSFVNNDFDILPENIRNTYENQPNLAYNWYLSSVSSNNVCYSIQTGHKRNESLEDERKLIANVLCSSYRMEKVENGSKSKIDTSAQDKEEPKVYNPEITCSDNSGFDIKFSGEDFGSIYFYYAYLRSADGGILDKSEDKSVTITTGIKNYYYIIDNKSDNYDFNINTAVKVPYENNESGVHINTDTSANCYLHIKAIDYAGNISSAIVVDLLSEIRYGIYPVEISSDNEKYLFRDKDENGVRKYFVNEKSRFVLEGGCFISPFASKTVQPQQNSVGKHWIYTALDETLGKGNSTTEKNFDIDGIINVISAKQERSDKSRKLKYTLNCEFVNGSDGKKTVINPIGLISNNGTVERVNSESKDMLILFCDGKGPEVEYEKTKLWYNASDFNKAFKLKLNCTDNGSGFKKNVVDLKQLDNTVWKNLIERNSSKASDEFDFLSYAGEGSFQYYIYSYDNVENITSIKCSFNVDLKPPVLMNVENCYGWTNKNVTIDINAKDELSGVKEIRLYDEAGNLLKVENGVEFKYCFQEEQDKLYFLVSEDIAGNVSKRYYFRVKIDKTTPEINMEGMSEEDKIVEGSNVFYYLPINTLNISSEDLNQNSACSGLVSLTLKNQNNQIILHLENDDENIALNKRLSAVYEVISVADGDYYSVVAVDAAGNVKKIFVVPKICIQNRVKRNVVHDNFEEEYGYYRIYE